MEFRRVFGRYSFWMVVVLALGLNIFLFFRTQGQQYSTWASVYEISEKELQRVYVEQIRELQTMPISDAVELYQKELQQVQEGESYTSEIEDDVRQNMVLPLLLYQSNYTDYLKKVQEDAVTLGTISIFADKDAFSSGNLKMTARDFAQLDGNLTMGSFRGISSVMEYRIADYLILVLMLVICWRMLEERKKGLWGIVRLAGGGRAKLAGKRLVLYAVSFLVIAVLMYGSTVASAWYYYGVPDLHVEAQSMQELGKMPLAITTGQFLTQFLIVKIAGTLVFGLLIWLILSAMENVNAAMVVVGLVLGAEYALFVAIPAQSKLNLFKYLNLFSYFFTDQLYENYLNLNLFGTPVNARRLLLAVLPVLIGVSTVAVFVVNTCKRPEKKGRFWAWLYQYFRRAVDGITSHLRGFGMELYKGLVVQKGLVFLFVGGWLLCQMFPVFDQNAYAMKPLFETRLEEWEGPIDSPETAQKMQEEKQWLDEQYAHFQDLQQQYESGELSWEEMEAAKMLMQPVDNRMAAYSEVESRIMQMKMVGETTGKTMWLLNYRWFLRLFNNQDPDVLQNQRVTGLVAILLCILLIAPVYAYEEQTGVRSVIRGSGKGRGRTIWRKQLYVFLMTFVTFGLVFGAYFWSVVRLHGVHGWNAPMQSIVWLSNSTWDLTVGQFTIVLYALRFLTLWAVAEVVLVLSGLLKKVQTTMLAGTFLILVPAALWTVGVSVLGFLSAARLLSTMEILDAAWFTGWSCFLPYIVVALVGIGCGIWSSRSWLRSR